MAVYKCGKYFYYDFEFGGRRYHKSTRMTNQRAAEQLESVPEIGIDSGKEWSEAL